LANVNLPAFWLLNPDMRDLSDLEWRVFTGGLLQSMSQLTDGDLPRNALALTHPAGLQPATYERLVEAGFWARKGDGYRILHWAATQTTKAKFRKQQQGSANRQQTYRDRQKEPAFTGDSGSGVTHNVTHNGLGEANREETSREEPRPDTQDLTDTFDPETGEVNDWVTAPIPGKDYEDGDAF
jgi:hypothetical protein